jgi:bifunctional DNA-binding transcriptional regulator/antitoxin component of YhaV-PrlF toxin-antitoxin module
MLTGYSGTPLARKLGIKEGCKILLIDAPPGYRTLLEPLPDSVQFVARLGKQVDLVHIFATRRSVLERALAAARRTLASSAVVWVSWPKKAAKVDTDITEDTVREVALPLGWVDIKVCAVDEVWSGLKLVVRKALR